MMPPIPNAQLEALAQRFVRFADQECGAYAPLYDRLARGIASDPELLTIAAHARSGQQAPLLLLAAVHSLLLDGTNHALGTFYPSVTHHTAGPPGDPLPAFRAFCRDHRDALIELVSTGLVETNEPRRCTVLLPAFATVARLASGRPLALIEVGASAGLNLLFDRYGYDYGSGRSARGSQCTYPVHLRAARGNAATDPRGATAGSHPRRHSTAPHPGPTTYRRRAGCAPWSGRSTRSGPPCCSRGSP